MTFLYAEELFPWTSKDEVSTAISSFRSYIDDSISIRYHIEVVFDDEDRVPFLYESIEDIEELLYIRKMESCRWFIEDIEGFSCRSFREIEGELDTLGLSS